LNNAFSRGDARLDYAYAKYAAGEQLEMLGGKLKNPLWLPKDLLWDTDIRPDGAAVHYSIALGDGIDAFVVPAYLVLDERIDDAQTPRRWVLQTGATFALG
jgi:hypothetical protein